MPSGPNSSDMNKIVLTLFLLVFGSHAIAQINEGNSTLKVRKNHSVVGTGKVLVVIDDVVCDLVMLDSAGRTIDPLKTINPKDIQSVKVLQSKDAMWAYGNKGIHGAILVTTVKNKLRSAKIHKE